MQFNESLQEDDSEEINRINSLLKNNLWGYLPALEDKINTIKSIEK